MCGGNPSEKNALNQYDELGAFLDPSRRDVYGGKNISDFQNNATMESLSALLRGNQSRALGSAGRGAGAQAAAYGLNPTSATQRAQSGVYGQYADQFSNLPMQLAQLKGMNLDQIYKILSLRQGTIAGQSKGWGQDIIPGLIEGGGKVGSAAILASDRRLKTNVSHIGHTPSGIPLYEYNYVWGGEKQVGVMADEIEQIIPEAVLIHPSGYKMVDYSLVR